MGPEAGEVTVRRARASDVEQLLALCGQAFGDSDVPVLRYHIEREGPEQFTVAVDGGRVVSALGLLSWRLRVGPVELPVGIVEYVMTLPEYRRRGLIRRQVDMVHRSSVERGDLLQLIVGIPYLYRRFGYGYGLPQGPRYQLRRGADTAMPSGWSARPAAPGDEEALRAIHQAGQASADVALLRDAEDWRFMLRTLPEREEHIVVVEREGAARGYARVWEVPGRSFAFEAGASCLTAARAVLAAVVEHNGPMGFAINDRPGTPISTLLLDSGVLLDRPYDAFVRAADLVGLLDRLRPLLSERLSSSHFAAESGELRVTTYESGALIRYRQGEVSEVLPAEPLQEADPGVLAVAPDLLPGLVLGANEPLELEDSHRDVEFMGCRGLVATLFPRMISDVIWPA